MEFLSSHFLVVGTWAVLQKSTIKRLKGQPLFLIGASKTTVDLLWWLSLYALRNRAADPGSNISHCHLIMQDGANGARLSRQSEYHTIAVRQAFASLPGKPVAILIINIASPAM